MWPLVCSASPEPSPSSAPQRGSWPQARTVSTSLRGEECSRPLATAQEQAIAAVPTSRERGLVSGFVHPVSVRPIASFWTPNPAPQVGCRLRFGRPCRSHRRHAGKGYGSPPRDHASPLYAAFVNPGEHCLLDIIETLHRRYLRMIFTWRRRVPDSSYSSVVSGTISIP
jgi:hypothetical protein